MVPALPDLPLHVRPYSEGYAGEFYAQMAVDPLLLDPSTHAALDLPAYRARRMFFSWTAFLLGLGQPLPIVHAYAIQDALFWVLLALLAFLPSNEGEPSGPRRSPISPAWPRTAICSGARSLPAR